MPAAPQGIEEAAATDGLPDPGGGARRPGRRARSATPRPSSGSTPWRGTWAGDPRRPHRRVPGRPAGGAGPGRGHGGGLPPRPAASTPPTSADGSPTPEPVAGYVAALHRRGLAPASVARRVAAVRGFHRFLVAEGLAGDRSHGAARQPAPPRRAAQGARPWRRCCACWRPPTRRTPEGRRDRALLEFLYATGARVAEAVGLDQLDLDLEEGTARVTGKGDKQRLVPVGGPACRALARLPARPPGLAARPGGTRAPSS